MHKKSETSAGSRSLSKPEDRTDWLIVLLVWAAGLGAAAQFGKIAVTLDAFRDIYAVSEVALGFLISCVGFVGLLFGVVGGILSPRLGIKRMFILGMFSAAILSALQSFSIPYSAMIILRVLEGASHLFIVIAGPILMARHSSSRTRPGIMTLWSSFFGLSYMLVALIAPWVIGHFGLQSLFIGHAFYMLVLGALLSQALPIAKTQTSFDLEHDNFDLPNLLKLHLKIYKSPWLSAAALGFVFYTGLYIALLTYIPEFVAPALRTGLSASLPFASIVTSLTFGVVLLRFVRPVNAVIIGYLLIGACAFPLLFVVGNDPLFVVFSIILLGSTGIVPGASFAALAELNLTDQDRAYATGAIAQLGNLGTSCGPPLLAAIISISGVYGTVGFVLLFCFFGVFVHVLLARQRSTHIAQRD
ncbi:cyanate permease [Planktotalea frisia]|uniref:Major facilitator superfamily protein n=1 Tax=Planktotalea frisia TaxID=696762 RepID=A0A1L9NYR9_9RHOB|nr:major facilitator superfamily protein [Planktotalea frisia]PZX30085.1 cyanate permease [Planktotalea frisia]